MSGHDPAAESGTMPPPLTVRLRELAATHRARALEEAEDTPERDAEDATADALESAAEALDATGQSRQSLAVLLGALLAADDLEATDERSGALATLAAMARPQMGLAPGEGVNRRRPTLWSEVVSRRRDRAVAAAHVDGEGLILLGVMPEPETTAGALTTGGRRAWVHLGPGASTCTLHDLETALGLVRHELEAEQGLTPRDDPARAFVERVVDADSAADVAAIAADAERVLDAIGRRS